MSVATTPSAGGGGHTPTVLFDYDGSEGVGKLAGTGAAETVVGEAGEFALRDAGRDHQLILGVGRRHIGDGVADRIVHGHQATVGGADNRGILDYVGMGADY